jgi:hypothetical protein
MRGASLALLLLASACIGRGDPGHAERVDAAQVLELVGRMESFYASLEDRSLDAVETFDDETLRVFFRTEQEFSDYYASLASQVRDARFRLAIADRVRIRTFRFSDPDTALVRVVLRGRHMRELRFWDLEVSRIDTWRHTSAGWMLSPDKL